MIGLHTPLVDKIGLHTVACGDVDAVLELVRRVGAKLEGAGDDGPTVIVCYEAGYEGFWLHRRLSALGIRVVVIDPASLLVDRRAKRAKTDRIDARSMVRGLMAFTRGEQQVLQRSACADRGAGRRPSDVTRAPAPGPGKDGTY